jgi:putative restriction endonuclease
MHWGGYWRWLRAPLLIERIWIRRGRCGVCRRTHALLPDLVLARRLDDRSTSNNDDPRNGVALCGVHHWAFDVGLIGVGPNHEVLLSRVVPRDDERADFLARFRHAQLRMPSEPNLRPAPEALAWHRENTFRAAA